MGDETKKPGDAMERLLRRWGAGESVRDAQGLDLQPPNVSGSRPKMEFVLRWSPLAAGLMLAIWGGLFYVGAKSLPQVPLEVALHTGTSQQQAEAAKTALQTLREEMDKNERGYVAKMEELARQAQAGEAKAADLDKAVKVQQAQLTATQERVTKLTAAATTQKRDAEEALAAAAKKAESERDTLAAKLSATEDQLLSTRVRLTAAAAELTQKQKQYDEAVASAKAAQDGVAAAKAKQFLDLELVQRSILSAAAPGQQGLRARQVACKQLKLTDRLTNLRNVNESTRKTLDRLEVVLIRLETMDANDARAAQSFGKLLTEGKVLERLDEALAMRQDAEAQQWLFEAKMILMGAQYA